MSFLFKKPKGTPGQVVDVTPPEFEGIRPAVAETITGLFGGGPAAPGELTAPITAPEEALVGQIATRTDPLLGAATGSAFDLLGAAPTSPISAVPGALEQLTGTLSGAFAPGAQTAGSLFQTEGLGGFIDLLSSTAGGAGLSPESNPFLQQASGFDSPLCKVVEPVTRVRTVEPGAG